MKSLKAASAVIISLSASNAALAQQDQCAAISSQTQATINSITQKYNSKIAEQQDAIKAKAAAIEDDANRNKPNNAAEAAIKFKIDVSSHIETIKLDLPTVTIRDQDIIFDLPDVTLKQQTWKYNVPQTKMVLRCVPGPPETVCHNELKDFGLFKTDVPVCSVRAGKQICTDIPEVYMAPTETVLGVPEVAMRQQKIRMGVPEFKMETQEIKFSVPDFTLRNIEVEMQKTKQESEQLSTTAQEGAKALSSGMKAEIDKASSDAVAGTLECEKKAVNAQRAQALNDVDKNISVVQAALQQAQSVGASALAGSMQASLAKLLEARKSINDQFDAAIKQMSASLPTNK